MGIVRRILQAVFVSLTATTMLFAGVPHFDCVCPNGSLKPFCLGLSTQASGCCCGGSCCSSSSGGCCCSPSPNAGQETEVSSCCSTQERPPEIVGSHEGSLAEGSCCQKTLAHDEFVAIIPAQTDARQELTAGFVALPPELCLVSRAPTTGRCPFSWQSYELPPPTDLVIALQHFLI